MITDEQEQPYDVEILGDFEGDVGGNVPVQGHGTVDGHPWYFRARGSAWSFDIAEEADADPVAVGDIGVHGWAYAEHYGEWPAAGWMSHLEAWQFIAKAIAMFRAGKMQYVTASNPLPSRPCKRWKALMKVNRGAYRTKRKRRKAMVRALRHVNHGMDYDHKPKTNP